MTVLETSPFEQSSPSARPAGADAVRKMRVAVVGGGNGGGCPAGGGAEAATTPAAHIGSLCQHQQQTHVAGSVSFILTR